MHLPRAHLAGVVAVLFLALGCGSSAKAHGSQRSDCWISDQSHGIQVQVTPTA
jgi:hypothetical protein